MQCPNLKCCATVDEDTRVCPHCGMSMKPFAPPNPGKGKNLFKEAPAQASSSVRVRKLANMSLVLAILSCPVLWPAVWVLAFFSRSVLRSAARNLHSPPLLSFALVVVIVALAAVITGHIAIAVGGRVPRTGGVSWRPVFGTLLGYLNIVVLIAFMALGFFGKWRPNMDMAVCAGNLTRIQTLLREYADKNRDVFPPLSPQPGVLMFSPDAIRPNDEISHLLTCPTIRYAKPRTTGPSHPFDDQSYFYLGYALRNDAAVEAFVRAYRKQIASGGTFDKDLVVEDAGETHTLHRLAPNSREVLRTSKDPLSVSPYEGQSPGYQVQCVTDDVPILIERDLGHRNIDYLEAPQFDGAWVLYLNDGVQFVERGTWPITEKTQRILAELAE